MSQSREERLAKAIDDVLIYMALATGGDLALPSCFRDAIMVGGPTLSSVLALRKAHGLPTNVVRPPELPHSWERCFILGDTGGILCRLIHVQKHPPSKLYRLRTLRAVPSWASEFSSVTEAVVRHSGSFSLSRWNQFWDRGKAIWCDLERRGRIKRRMTSRGPNGFYEKEYEEFDGEEQIPTLAASSFEWSFPLLWHVRISYPGSRGVLLATDAVGAKALFRLRDVPDGRGRRQALLHWVREHWRQNRHSPEDEVLVRQHLRGATEFQWFGMLCTIIPSDQDAAENIRLREERAAKGSVMRPRRKEAP